MFPLKKNNIKTPKEIKVLREGGKRLASVLNLVQDQVRPGISTGQLNAIAEREIIKSGGKPSFKGYYGYPAGLCTSINDAVVHGIPSKLKTLAKGDIIGLDAGMKFQDLYTDMAVTVPVGNVNPDTLLLIQRTRHALDLAIQASKPGNMIGDIGNAVQTYAESFDYGVIRDLVGHGVGYEVHEPPRIPNFGKPGTGTKIEIGMVLALEPMIAMGGYHIVTQSDGWTTKTKDHSLTAHFEHTIVITDHGAEILTIMG